MPRSYRPPIKPDLRDAVIAEKGRHCTYCGKGPLYKRALQMDHVVPTVSGGTNTLANLVPCCGPCNRAKQAKSLVVYIERRIPALERELEMLRNLAAIYRS